MPKVGLLQICHLHRQRYVSSQNLPNCHNAELDGVHLPRPFDTQLHKMMPGLEARCEDIILQDDHSEICFSLREEENGWQWSSKESWESSRR